MKSLEQSAQRDTAEWGSALWLHGGGGCVTLAMPVVHLNFTCEGFTWHIIDIFNLPQFLIGEKKLLFLFPLIQNWGKTPLFPHNGGTDFVNTFDILRSMSDVTLLGERPCGHTVFLLPGPWMVILSPFLTSFREEVAGERPGPLPLCVLVCTGVTLPREVLMWG